MKRHDIFFLIFACHFLNIGEHGMGHTSLARITLSLISIYIHTHTLATKINNNYKTSEYT